MLKQQEKLEADVQKMLAENNRLRKADCFELIVRNDFYRAQNREQREHILMREEDTDAPAAASRRGQRGRQRGA